MNKKILLSVVFIVFSLLIMIILLWQFGKLPLKKEIKEIFYQQPQELLYACPLNLEDITGVMQWDDGWPLVEYNKETHLQDNVEDVDITAYYGSAVLAPTDGEIIRVEEGRKIKVNGEKEEKKTEGEEKKDESDDKKEEKCGEEGKWMGGCTQVNKKPYIATASGDLIINKVFIKAKNSYFTDSNNGCYLIEGLDSATVKVEKVGEDSPDCENIAHVKFITSLADDTSSPEPVEKNKDSSTGKTTQEDFYFITLKGNDGYYYELGHLESVTVKIGDKVSKNQQLGNLITFDRTQLDNRICQLDKDKTNKNCYKVFLHIQRFSGSEENPEEQSTLNFLSDYCQLTRPAGINPEFPELPTINCFKITSNPNIERCFKERPAPSPSDSIVASTNPQASDLPLASTESSPISGVSPSPITGQSPSPIASPGLNQLSLELMVKLAGVPANNNNINLKNIHRQKDIRVILQDEQGKDVFKKENDGWQAFYYDPELLAYKTTIIYSTNEVPTGKYKLLLKGPMHRQTKFCQEDQKQDDICPPSQFINLNLSTKSYSFDFTNTPLEFGDIDQDSVVNVKDYSKALNCVKQDVRIGSEAYESECKNTDGNLDGVVDITDIDLLYKTLSVQKDDI